MSNIDKGLLIYAEWLDAMSALPAREFKRIVTAMWNLQFKGEEPPVFQGKSAIVAAVIFPHIRRRIQKADAGRLGAAARWTEEGAESAQSAIGSANGKNKAMPSPIAEQSIAEQSRAEQTLTEQEQTVRERCAPKEQDARADKAESGYFSQGQASEKQDVRQADKRAYGCYGNVMLTEEEYADLKGKIPDGYLDVFSEKLYVKGYRYPDHYRAINDWWARDRILWDAKARGAEKAREIGGGAWTAPDPDGDADARWERFYELAVRRSLGIPDDQPVDL